MMLPNLDDRRWAELVDVGRALIPLEAPEWTDHNVHDPGITILELLAWIAETDIYRLNRVPDRHKLKFLALLGIAPQPPKPARAILELRIKDPSTEALRVPEGTEFSGIDPNLTEIRFRTLQGFDVAVGQLATVQLRDPSGKFRDLTETWSREESFNLFGDDPRIGTEFYFGFDSSLPTGMRTVLYFILDDPEARAATRECLLEEERATRERCRRTIPGCDGDGGSVVQPSTPPADPPPLHHSVKCEWEFLEASSPKPVWRRLRSDRGEVADGTRSFTLDGTVALCLPGEGAPAEIGAAVGKHWYVRCRLASGAFDAPPVLKRLMLNGLEVEQAVPVGTMMEIDHHRIEAVLLGTGHGTPNPCFFLPQAPIQVESLALYSRQGDEWQSWTRRADFDASGRGDRHFALDADTGRVAFGDGEHGSVPAKGARIYAAYRSTSADGGNLAAGRIDRIARSNHNTTLLGDDGIERLSAALAITNPVAAWGGARAEALGQAVGRALARLGEPSRAATVDDYLKLVTQVPGARIARVEVRPNMHPCLSCVVAQGVVTVFVLPRLPADRPSPSAGLLRLVAAYLAPRRIIGTRVEVVAPSYREVVIRATVSTTSGASKVDVQRRVTAALENFLDPLRGGPAGSGWPLGRDVYRSEILQVIDGVAGVDHVLSMDLIADGTQPECMRICVPATSLVLSGEHQIQAE